MSTPVKIGINGFGRIGRLIFRATMGNKNSNTEVTQINHPSVDTDYLLYLLKYDSAHGKIRLSLTKSFNRKIRSRHLED